MSDLEKEQNLFILQKKNQFTFIKKKIKDNIYA